MSEWLNEWMNEADTKIIKYYKRFQWIENFRWLPLGKLTVFTFWVQKKKKEKIISHTYTCIEKQNWMVHSTCCSVNNDLKSGVLRNYASFYACR